MGITGKGGGVDARVMAGFAAFTAWQQGLLMATFSFSGDLLLSPTALTFLAGCLVLVATAHAARTKRPVSSRKARLLVLAGAPMLATALAAAATLVDLLAVGFLASAAGGAAGAMLLYAWAEELCSLERNKRMPTVLAALVLSGAAQLGQTALGAWGGFALGLLYACLSGFLLMRGKAASELTEVSFRPTGAAHFRTPLAGFVVLAVVFGLVIGTSSQALASSGTQVFAGQVSLSLTAGAAVLLAVRMLLAAPASLSGVMRFLAPAMALLFLAHILFKGGLNGWLPCITLGMWQVIQALAILVMLDLAQSGYASVSLVMPVGWSLVCLGQGIGAFLGQATSILLGASDAVVQVVSVVQAIAAVTGATLLAAGQYPRGGESPDPLVQDTAQTASPTSGGRTEDPVAAAIAAIAGTHGFSEREAEVAALLAAGNTRLAVAKKLVISENTVRVHVKNIYAKLGIHSRQQLVDMVDRKANALRQ